MNAAIRRTALTLGVAFLALFANLNIIQVGRSDELNSDPRNRRQIIREFGTRRGDILAADNTVVARSIVSDSGQYKYRREYPLGELFGQITGYYSFYYGTSGIERSYDDVLLGEAPQRRIPFLDELFSREPAGNPIRLTIHPQLQRLAKRKFGDQRGGAAVIDSETGAILALWGNPSYDPSPLALSPLHETEIRDAWQDLNSRGGQPLLSRAYAQRYPPGSTFKIVGAAAGLLNGMTPDTRFPDPSQLDLPDTNKSLPNYQGGPCVGGTISMRTALQVSCNTTFAQIAMRLGPETLERAAARFGIGRVPDLEVAAASSCIVAIPGAGCGEAAQLSRPATAYSGIGQQDVRMTPLQMAIVGAAAGNGGYRVEPHLVERVFDPTGETIAKTKIRRTRILPKKAGRDLKQMMIDVVRYGTGAVVGFEDASRGIIGGKTGTAQTGIEGEAPHVWFVAFGPGIAVAVVVEHGGDLRSEATGGRVAGPIAKALLERAMQLRPQLLAQREGAGLDVPDTRPSPTPTPTEEP